MTGFRIPPNYPTRHQVGLAGAVLLVAIPALLPYHADPLRAFYQDCLAFLFGLVLAPAVAAPRAGGDLDHRDRDAAGRRP